MLKIGPERQNVTTVDTVDANRDRYAKKEICDDKI